MKGDITSKKLKVIGTQQYVNVNTGEVEEFNVLSIEDKDINFNKIWIGHILEAIDEIGNAKMKILMYLISNRNTATNMVIKTIDEISKETETSKKTVIDTLKVLSRHDIIKRKTGVIFLNPNVVFRGRYNTRMKILLEYNILNEEKQEDNSNLCETIETA